MISTKLSELVAKILSKQTMPAYADAEGGLPLGHLHFPYDGSRNIGRKILVF